MSNELTTETRHDPGSKGMHTDPLPELVAHADWGKDPRKQWYAGAVLIDGHYHARSPQPVGGAASFLRALRTAADPGACVLVGFDFPIGIPQAYAARAGVSRFLEILPRLGAGEWAEFFQVAAVPAEIGLRRPFYPQGTAGVLREHLLRGLGLASPADLLRRCDHGNDFRNDACPLFWTLGGNQVGRGAISGWQQVLVPAAEDPALNLKVWPFAGELSRLCTPGSTVVVETYPAEFYHHLGVVFPRPKAGIRSGKRIQADRAANARVLFQWARESGVSLDPALQAEITSGFGGGSDGEDRFDAVVGLLGILNVVLGRRSEGAPDDPSVRQIEGWILGRSPASRTPRPTIPLAPAVPQGAAKVEPSMTEPPPTASPRPSSEVIREFNDRGTPGLKARRNR